MHIFSPAAACEREGPGFAGSAGTFHEGCGDFGHPGGAHPWRNHSANPMAGIFGRWGTLW